eukprot:Hpha_TRINITY_DN31327_c0_g1::TRINITY_DN31327_c0_g1_i1::g.194542::m.194542
MMRYSRAVLERRFTSALPVFRGIRRLPMVGDVLLLGERMPTEVSREAARVAASTLDLNLRSLAQGNCLTTTLAMQTALRALGIPSECKVAVTVTEEIAAGVGGAHCWVEVDGCPLDVAKSNVAFIELFLAAKVRTRRDAEGLMRMHAAGYAGTPFELDGHDVEMCFDRPQHLPVRVLGVDFLSRRASATRHSFLDPAVARQRGIKVLGPPAEFFYDVLAEPEEYLSGMPPVNRKVFDDMVRRGSERGCLDEF